jgi:hypothetical protein
MAIGDADGRGDAAGAGVLEKTPQTTSGQAEAADFVSEPNAESAAATATVVAVAAKDTLATPSFSLRAAVVKAV